MKICGTSLSQKKINGKSTIALDWSKNKEKSTREYFNHHFIIINLCKNEKEEQWWKKNPKQIKCPIKIKYTHKIPRGVYIIDKKYCKYYVELSSNNKTNTLIDSQYLYIMLVRSINQKLFINLPKPNNKIKFNILNAFSE